MNIQIAVSGKRAIEKSNFLYWLKAQLESMGADITVIDDTDYKVSIVSADKMFLSKELMKEVVATSKETTSILQEAHQVIYGDREQTYGDPGKNLRTIACYWNIHLNAAKSVNAGLTENDVAGMMILLKQARLANSPTHRDSLVDIAGYAGLQDRIQSSKAVDAERSTRS